MVDDAKPRYYPLVDSVLFAEQAADEIPHRIVGASAALLLDMLIHRTVPVLSQSQVIDSNYVLDLVRHDSSGAAFLGLIEDSTIQTRFLPKGLAKPLTGDRFTVLNVFSSRMKSGFHFSAWPELADIDVREQVYANVQGTSKEPIGGELGERLDALRALDAAFRYSSAREHAKKLSKADRLGPRVVADFTAHDRESSVQQMCEAVQRLAEAAGEDDTGRPVHDLNSRSTWRALLREAANNIGIDDRLVADMSTVVDLHYNCVVATSIGAASCADETSEPRVPIGLQRSSVSVELDPRVTFMLDPSHGVAGLTWDDVRARLKDQRSAGAAARLSSLSEDRLIEIVDGKRLVKVVSGAPRRLVRAAHGGIPAGGAGFEFGSHMGVFGAVLGGIIGEALTPEEFLVGGKAVGRWEAAIRRRAVGRVRRSVGITVDARLQ